ncbi:MAG TPA: hypothetical protein VGX21_08805 [Methylomirabilota bacterium]|nr:hypothetical protein [Methylomirabilota bacterium]
MDCPECGRTLVCAACGSPVEETVQVGPGPGPESAIRSAGPQGGDQTFLVVARGHGDLLEQLKEVVGELGWVRPIQDRRDDPTILPREGREGTVHVDEDLKS